MSKTPILDWKKVVKILSKFGYELSHQTGSHMRFVCKNRRPVTVPKHKTIGKELLKNICHQAGTKIEDFVAHLKSLIF